MILRKIILSTLALLMFVSCSDDSREPWPRDYYSDVLIPEIAISNGGVQSIPAPSGSVYYFNDPAHTKEESDIQMDDGIGISQHARRYFKVSGTAFPDDSGYSDRYYHSVTFGIRSFSGTNTTNYHYITLPVDTDNRFEGYLYFLNPGTNTVFAYRAMNDFLYPDRGKRSTVQEGYSCLGFWVIVDEAVPASLTNMLPTSQVNSGNKAIRDYTQRILDDAGATTDQQKVDAIYNFLVDGDAAGKFVYSYYDEIMPGYLKESWNAVFIASHFLKRRVGVCNDFAELFAAMARSQNIPVMKVRGTDPGPEGGGHMWNKVYFNGQWWRLDATWANGSVAAGYGRTAYAEWSATPSQMNDFANEHENTYTEGFQETY